MPKYGGFFLKGLAGGLQPGFEMGQKIQGMKWQKKERERIQKEEDETMEAVSVFNKKVEGWLVDKELSDDERMQMTTAYIASAHNVRELIEGSYKAVIEMDKDTVEHNLAYLKSYREAWGDYNLDLSTIPEMYDYYKGLMIGVKGKQMFMAGDSLLKKQYEARQQVVPEQVVPEEPSISDYNTGLNYLKNFINAPLETFEKARAGIENKFGIDYSGITQEALREVKTEDKKYYSSAEEAMTTSPDIKGFTKHPVQISLNQWKVDYTKETEPKQTPEEEMKEYYQKQFGTFKRNLLSGINDLGFIISPENRNKYLSINFEEYMQFMQGEIPERFKDDIKVTDQSTGETKSIRGPTLFDKILNKIGLKKLPTEEVGGALGETVSPTEFQPDATGMEMPKLGEPIPTPKVSTEGKEALIPTMTKEELYNAMLNTDRTDPLWELLYKEAVKRGYIVE